MTESRPLRLILHAGLHKSGTTTFQSVMRAAYGTPVDGIWFPLMDATGFGHELVAWTVRDRLAHVLRTLVPDGPVPDIAPVHLRALIAKAAEGGVDVLVVSTEELDRIDDDTAAAVLRDELGSTPTTLLLTVTPPVHRWYSAWQESLKGGASIRPLDDEYIAAAQSLTAPGALGRLLELLPNDEVVVRLVRPAPPEPGLVRSLLVACGIDPAAELVSSGPENTSLREDAELLRRLNALGLTVGCTGSQRLDRLAVFRAAVQRVPRSGAARPGYGLPHWFRAAAELEADLLRELARREGVTLVDPHRLLDNWVDTTAPDWIRAIETSEWPEVPDADGRSRPRV